MSSEQTVDVLVVGAGVTGVAIARALALRAPRLSIVVVEKEPGVARHTSGRNSGVAHAGFNPRPGTLKARFCVEGNRRIRTFCRERRVPARDVGTLVLARTDDEAGALEELRRRGEANGVPDLRLLSAGELGAREPNVRGHAALFAPTGAVLDARAYVEALARDAQDQIEVEVHPTLLTARQTVLRAMAYGNHARMGDYRDALTLAARQGGTPDITRTRRVDRVKYGFTLNAEQPLTEDGDTGLFGRFGWNDGATETFTYTEADWTLSTGAQVAGTWWHRHEDRVGLGIAANGLSDAHADYLARGGLGFELGDGRLRYRPETIVESYYVFQPVTWLALTLDYQFIADPGHNSARGPVSVVSIRLHLERTITGAG